VWDWRLCLWFGPGHALIWHWCKPFCWAATTHSGVTLWNAMSRATWETHLVEWKPWPVVTRDNPANSVQSTSFSYFHIFPFIFHLSLPISLSYIFGSFGSFELCKYFYKIILRLIGTWNGTGNHLWHFALFSGVTLLIFDLGFSNFVGDKMKWKWKRSTRIQFFVI